MIFHRPELCQILFDSLPANIQEKILTKKKVVSIEQDEHTVCVSCADGSIFKGSMVMGADGVYSKTREQLRQAMLRAGRQAECDEEQPYESSYRLLWCTLPRPPSTSPGIGGETQDKDRTLQLMVGKEWAWILLYEKLETPTRERIVYSKEDIDNFAESFANYPVSETLSLKDIFQSNKAGMTTLAEGVVKNFSHGRIVLVGDACHRFTPNAGLGLNNGIQDVAAVCNGIYAAVQDSPDGNPSLATLEATFNHYRNERLAFVKKDFRASALLTRLQAWANTWFYVCARFLLVPDWFQRLTMRNIAVPNMRLAPVLKYASAIKEPYVGTVAWANPIQQKEIKQG